MTDALPVSPTGGFVKRSLTIKTLVSDAFKQQASDDLNHEKQLIDQQLEHLELQVQNNLRQLEEATRQGHNVAQQLDQLHTEAAKRRHELTTLKNELAQQLDGLANVPNGQYIKTGQLENWVPLAVGDNLYQRLRGAEVLVNDGVITAILEAEPPVASLSQG
jgi:ABC-type phosphate transport system auxiliary subunit